MPGHIAEDQGQKCVQKLFGFNYCKSAMQIMMTMMHMFVRQEC